MRYVTFLKKINFRPNVRRPNPNNKVQRDSVLLRCVEPLLVGAGAFLSDAQAFPEHVEHPLHDVEPRREGPVLDILHG